MSPKQKKIIDFIRVILWITIGFFIYFPVFLIIELDFKELNKIQNLMILIIIFSTMTIPGYMLFESSEEEKLYKQIRVILSVIIVYIILYALFIIAVYLTEGRWVFPYPKSSYFGRY